ncbi:MAG: peptidoglycan DD-metalloendopeptidase family protein [Pseudomonadales bacterium]|nr:peptidoglycan DD-metalloendopeptidase family protein [Pseudomonadales bacterium]
MEEKRKPSRKALEYRVYWLERKLAYRKANRQRELNAARIEDLPPSAMKEILHLNNEFQRANEEHRELITVSEQLNDDLIRKGEQTVRINEVALGKIAESDRINRRSRQLQEKTRKINNEAARTTIISRQVNKSAREALEATSRLNDETRYLNRLSRGQHEATDQLNKRTEQIGLQGMRVVTTGIRLNNELKKSAAESGALNKISRDLHHDLIRTQADLETLQTQTETQSEMTERTLESLTGLGERCETAIDVAEHAGQALNETLTHATGVIDQAEALNRISEENINRYHDLEQRGENLLARVSLDTDRLLTETRSEINVHLSGITEESRLSVSNATQTMACELREIGDSLSGQFEALESTTRDKLTDLVAMGESLTQEVIADTRVRLNEMTDANCQQAQARHEALSADISQRLDHAGERLEGYVSEAESAWQRTDKLLEKTDAFTRVTREQMRDAKALCNETRGVTLRCEAVITQVDAALGNLTSEHGQLKDEAQSLLNETGRLNETTLALQEQTRLLNDDSLQMQKDTVRTQELSQEINRHSLELHEESRNISNNFSKIKEQNEVLVEELKRVRERLQAQLEAGQQQQTALRQQIDISDQQRLQSEALNRDMHALMDDTDALLTRTGSALDETRQLNQQTRDSLLAIQQQSESMERLAAESRAAARAAEAAADVATAATAQSEESRQALDVATSEARRFTVDAAAELEKVAELRRDTQTVTEQSRLAWEELQDCINSSRAINDEFMRGLEAATGNHQRALDDARSLNEATVRIQHELEDVLSLRDGIEEFRDNVSHCEARLNDYLSTLSQCQRTSAEQEEQLEAYQRRLEGYQGDTARYREAVSQFENRTRRLESFFSEYDARLKDIETSGSASLREELEQQTTRMRDFERDLRRELQASQQALEQTMRGARELIEFDMEQLTHEVRQQIQSAEDKITRKIGHVDDHMDELRTEQNALLSEIQALKEESERNHSLNLSIQDQQQSVRQETGQQENRLVSVENNLADLGHRLENYRALLETRIDDTAGADASQKDMLTRLEQMEAQLEQQQQQIRDQSEMQNRIRSRLVKLSETEDLVGLVSRYSESMEDAVTTNKALKASLQETQAAHRQLQEQNRALQQKLASLSRDTQKMGESVANRLSSIEQREQSYQARLERLQNHELDTASTMQEMQLAIKASTQAMRETQRTLMQFQRPDLPAPDPEEVMKSRSWSDSSRQAVLSALFAVGLTSLGMSGIFGTETVDAAVTQQNLLTPQAAQTLAAPAPQTAATYSTERALSGFTWPVNFGVMDPSTVEYRPHHQGITIRAELGDPVVAVNDGEVIYSNDELRGYGNVVMIRHSDDLISVYGSNQYTYVKPGDHVARGQLIGDVGQLFNEDSAGLYFEMRYKGEPQDPFGYLAASPDNLNEVIASL